MHFCKYKGPKELPKYSPITNTLLLTIILEIYINNKMWQTFITNQIHTNYVVMALVIIPIELHSLVTQLYVGDVDASLRPTASWERCAGWVFLFGWKTHRRAETRCLLLYLPYSAVQDETGSTILSKSDWVNHSHCLACLVHGTIINTPFDFH